jgi:thiol-disulfide isomerase/thioredoxin
MKPDLFTDGVILRLFFAGGIIFLGWMLFRAFGLLTLSRARNPALRFRRSLTPGERSAAATLLYFTAPGCVPCKTVQRPAIQRLLEQMGDALEVIEIDASAQPEMANQWGVMSVPTTFVIDAQGAPRYVNHGVATLDKLLRQINELKQ